METEVFGFCSQDQVLQFHHLRNLIPGGGEKMGGHSFGILLLYEITRAELHRFVRSAKKRKCGNDHATGMGVGAM